MWKKGIKFTLNYRLKIFVEYVVKLRNNFSSLWTCNKARKYYNQVFHLIQKVLKGNIQLKQNIFSFGLNG